MTGLDATSFQALFDAARHSVFRLEAHQTYAVPADDEELVAFRTGAPRPERSVRTSPWLRRMALQAVNGVEWRRLRVVQQPLTEYTRFELIAFVESQATGEQIRLTDDPTEVDDFWLIDCGTPDAVGVWMHYDDAGNLLARQRVEEAGVLLAMDDAQQSLWPSGTPLNVWLADRG